MEQANMEQYTETVHSSLVRPQMYMGCDRNAFLILFFVSIFLAGPLGILRGNYAMFFIAIVFWFIGRQFLAWMGKNDPYMRQVLKKNIWQLPFYPATAYAASNEKYPSSRNGNLTAMSCAGYLPYGALIAPGIILLKDGGLLGAFEYSGNDLSTATERDKNDVCRQAANALRDITDGFVLHFEAVKAPVTSYPTGNFSEIVTYCIDKERKDNHEKQGLHFETRLFCFVKWKPVSDIVNTVSSMQNILKVFSKEKKKIDEIRIDERLERFNALLQGFANSFSTKFRVNLLEDEDLLSAISLCVAGKNIERPMPDTPWTLDSLLACEIENSEPFLFDNKFVKVVAIDGLPATSKPAVLLRLERLSFEYRWSSRFIPMSFQEAHEKMTKEQRTWESKMRPLMSQMFNAETTRIDKDAVEQAEDAVNAISELQKGNINYGYYTSVIIIRDKNYAILEEKAREVVRVLQECLFSARIETRNTLEAFMGAIPGDEYCNIRKPLIKSTNLSHFIMLSSVWTGEKYCPCNYYPKKSPCLMQTTTEGGVPFKLNLHVGDLGHTLILGPTGSGKSTLLSTILAQFDRYKNGQAFFFDKGRSVFPLISAMRNASFYEMGADEDEYEDISSMPILCPLASLENDADTTWAADYIETLIQLNGVDITPAIRKEIGSAIHEMAQGTKTSKERSLTFLQVNVQSDEISNALQPFTEGGTYGKYLDGTATNIKYAKYTCFEIEKLMNLGNKVVVPVLLYLFHEIEKRLDGRPSLIVLDEAWVPLKNPLFAAKIAEWLRVLRKSNCAVIMATQSISEVVKSDISSEIFESCKTRILLANPEANAQEIKKFYTGNLQLSDAETNAVATAVPKREYFYVSPYGKRKFSLDLKDLQLSFVGASGKDDLRKVERYKAQYGHKWPIEYLRKERNLEDWAQYYEVIYNKYYGKK